MLDLEKPDRKNKLSMCKGEINDILSFDFLK